MAQCTTSGEQFISFVYSPCVSLLVSEDVENICLKDNLTFTELLKPFSQLSKDVILRDSNNLVHTLSNLRIKFLDVSTPPPSAVAARINLREVVSACASSHSQPTRNVTNGSLGISVPVTTPWFEAWRYVFIKSLWPSTHEFLDHSLACLLVVSTNHPDPVAELVRLTEKQSQLQRNSDASYPRWFSSNIGKYYVLVHDASQGERRRADALYEQMENRFGSANCYFLSFFSTDCKPDQSQQQNDEIVDHSKAVQPVEDGVTSDPWLSHLLPDGLQMGSVQGSSTICNITSSSLKEDPLVNGNNLHPNFGSLTNNGSTIHSSVVCPRYFNPHGRHLSQADCDRIRKFVQDFVIRSLLPWVEQTMKSLNDQVAHRMRLSRSLLSATKKFFSSAVSGSTQNSSSSTPVNPVPLATNLLNTTNTTSLIGMSGSGANWPPACGETVMARNSVVDSKEDSVVQLNASLSHATACTVPVVVYTYEAPEMQMRRLADLAFLFQQYEVAYQTYNVLKRDFHSDAAWLHYAAAQEMSALSIYLQGSTSQRQYPYHYVDSSVTIYLQTCQAAELALRATLVNTEVLCSRGLYGEAAMSLLRLTSQDDDLTSGLLIEQAAHCVLRMRRPMLRKFGFRMALAAHRFNRAGQSHLTIRTYKVAAPILMGRRWSLIENHINFNVGKQAYLIQDLANSVEALRRNLTQCSRQPAECQLIFIREYLVVLKQFLTHTLTVDGCSPLTTSYTNFPLPLIRSRDLKVMLGKPVKHGEDLLLEARGVQFADADDLVTELNNVENVLMRAGISDGSVSWTEWMDSTDVSDFEDEFGAIDFTYFKQDNTSFSHKRMSLSKTSIPVFLEKLLMQSEMLMPSQHTGNKKIVSLESSRCHPLLFVHHKTALACQPVAPVGEYVTVQVSLENPMRIPLVFANLHLLWSFEPSLSDPCENQIRQLKQVTNETPLDQIPPSRQIVASEVIPELIMLPGERKALDITVLPKQLGHLRINGLCFDWIYPSSQHLGRGFQDQGMTLAISSPDGQQQTNGDRRSNISDAHQSQIRSSEDSVKQILTGSITDPNSVRGKICFTPDETNFHDHDNPTPSGSPTSPFNSTDRMLWTITHPTALLRVAFSDFPMKLMQGEVFPLTLSLTNAGLQPLHKVRVASNWLGFISFQLDAVHQNGNDPDTMTTDVMDTLGSAVFRVNPSIQPWLNVPMDKDPASAHSLNISPPNTLPPGASIVIPMWFRAPHLSSTLRRSGPIPTHRWRSRRTPSTWDVPARCEQRTVHLVFQYASLTPNPCFPELNTRFVRHRSDLELHPSLRFKALACRNLFSEPRDLFIQLIIQNVTRNAFRNSFEILQVSCASRSWILKPIENTSKYEKESGISLAPGEAATLNFRGSFFDANACKPNMLEDRSSSSTGYTVFSTVPLVPSVDCSRSSIVPSRSPFADFYYRSGCVIKRKASDRVTQNFDEGTFISLDMTLIVFWRSYASRPNRTDGASYGQSHVPLLHLNRPISVPMEFQSRVRAAHKSHSIYPQTQPTVIPHSSRTCSLSQLVQLRLHHPIKLHHGFASETNQLSLCAQSPFSADQVYGESRQHQSLPSKLQSQPLRRKCVSLLKVPVEIELFNAAVVPVIAKLDAALDDSRLTEPLSNISDLVSNTVPSFNSSKQPEVSRTLWSGPTRKFLSLQPRETQRLTFHALTTRPGLFDTSGLVLRAALASDELPVQNFVRQTIPLSYFVINTDKSQQCT